MVIDGVEYAPVKPVGESRSIFVCDRSWVLYGHGEIDGEHVVITDCRVIRLWGTTRGLGQLATEGPQSGTKLDPQPETRVHASRIVMEIQCKTGVWK